MKRLLSALQIKRGRARGFTLAEASVAMGVFMAVGLTAFAVLRSGLLLSSQNIGLNVSSLKGRETIDQVNERVRYAMSQPTLIDKNGNDLSGGTTGDGILIKSLVGTPYVVKDSAGGTSDIAATAKQFVLEYRPELPAPSVGDCILMETVARPELEISAVSTMSASGAILRKLVTTTTAIGEIARPSNYRVTGTLYRKEAYVFADTEAVANPRAELRHYYRVATGTDFTLASNYNVVATAFRRIGGQSYFFSSTSNGTDTTNLRALVNSSARMETIARNSNISTFTTIPVQMRLWALNR